MPGTVADDLPLYRNGAWTCATYSQPMRLGRLLALIEDLAFATLETLYRGLQANNSIGRLRVLLAPKARLANAKNALLSTIEDVKRRLATVTWM